ncbi:uncharacterized protein DMAD_07987 [Drosophila madeirensis]|uniref:Uncharacterized protein n=1 Tax=Drosophila madeirensis TaxID=30013 RepID=A0AAU9F7F2_DROMD
MAKDYFKKKTDIDSTPHFVEAADAALTAQDGENEWVAVLQEHNEFMIENQVQEPDALVVVETKFLMLPMHEEWEDVKKKELKEVKEEKAEEQEEKNDPVVDAIYLQGFLDGVSGATERFAQLMSQIQDPPEPPV